MTQPGHFLTAAQCWLALGQTNQAFNASLTAYRLRGAYAQRYGCKFFTYAGRDCELLSQLMHGADRVALARYVNLLDNAARLPLAGSDANCRRARHDLDLAKQLLNNQ